MEKIPLTSKAYCNDYLRDLVPAKGLLLFILVIIKDHHLDISQVTRWVKTLFCFVLFFYTLCVQSIRRKADPEQECNSPVRSIYMPYLYNFRRGGGEGWVPASYPRDRATRLPGNTNLE